MLTHGEVIKSLDQIREIDVEARPDFKSSSKHPTDSDEPKYWQFFITPRGTSTKILVAAIYNSNGDYVPDQELRGTLCALVKEEKSGSCDVPQEEIDLLTTALTELTEGEVYNHDGEYGIKKL